MVKAKMMKKRLVFSVEEKKALIEGIDEARRRLLDLDDMTESDARSLLRETLGDAIYLVLMEHKDERQLT